MPVDDGDLRSLEDRVERALAAGQADGLDVLGYGEISLVLRLESGGRAYAAKRLPVFDSLGQLEAYGRCLEDYLKQLQAAGTVPVPTELRSVPQQAGRFAAYCVQPMLPAGSLLPDRLRGANADAAVEILTPVLDRMEATISPAMGLDAQLSNWAIWEGELVYLDVTTPMMRRADGRELLDMDLFIASLPWIARGAVRRFLLGSILNKYYELRAAILDLLGNAIKEGLEANLSALLTTANERARPPITEQQVRGYYADDARMWAALQMARRADAWWQRTVRGRPYPFLLPGRIERRR